MNQPAALVFARCPRCGTVHLVVPAAIAAATGLFSQPRHHYDVCRQCNAPTALFDLALSFRPQETEGHIPEVVAPLVESLTRVVRAVTDPGTSPAQRTAAFEEFSRVALSQEPETDAHAEARVLMEMLETAHSMRWHDSISEDELETMRSIVCGHLIRPRSTAPES